MSWTKYILEGYGRLQAKVWAAEALIDRTAGLVSQHIHAPRASFTAALRGEIAVRKSRAMFLLGQWYSQLIPSATEVAASKAQMIETALETSSKIFEFTGASASLSKYGFDRFWRNTRGRVT